MLIANGDGREGSTPRVGSSRVIKSGIPINCMEKRNNAQFQGQSGVFTIGRHLGSQESTAANTNALRSTPGNRWLRGAQQTAMTTRKNAIQANFAARISMM